MESFWAPHQEPNTRERRHERGRVEMLLRALDLTHRLGDLWDDYQAHRGVRRLTFESFDRIFDTFRRQLVAKSIYRTAPEEGAMTLKSWFRHFERTFVWA